MRRTLLVAVATVCIGLVTVACGGDDDADTFGIGAQCGAGDTCADNQQCLQFKGGYCGSVDCKSNADCPGSSACVAHTDGKNYCFRTCTDKAQCNANRDADKEANCSSSITYVSGKKEGKACVPPS